MQRRFVPPDINEYPDRFFESTALLAYHYGVEPQEIADRVTEILLRRAAFEELRDRFDVRGPR